MCAEFLRSGKNAKKHSPAPENPAGLCSYKFVIKSGSLRFGVAVGVHRVTRFLSAAVAAIQFRIIAQNPPAVKGGLRHRLPEQKSIFLAQLACRQLLGGLPLPPRSRPASPWSPPRAQETACCSASQNRSTIAGICTKPCPMAIPFSPFRRTGKDLFPDPIRLGVKQHQVDRHLVFPQERTDHIHRDPDRLFLGVPVDPR